MNEPTPYCIDGGTRHSWGHAGLDVFKDELWWVRRCIYCGKVKRRRYRGWKRGTNGKVTT